jgi:predicted N-acetyltransferase YhbS
MASPLTIRAWQPTDDVDGITKLLHRAYAPLAQAGLRYLATHQSAEITRERLTSGYPLVALAGGAIVGTATLYPPDAASPCELYRQPGVYCFGQFAVSPELQRGGIGRQLVEHLEAVARQLGATQLALDTAEGAVHLVEWYERLGFRLVQYVEWEVTNYRSVVLSKSLSPRQVSATGGPIN